LTVCSVILSLLTKMSALLVLALSLISSALVFAAPAVDMLPSNAEVARLVRRSSYNRGWDAIRDSAAAWDAFRDAAAATPSCEDTCFKQNYYTNMPTGGYDKTAGCKAMKASYKCILNAAGCVDATKATEYQGYVKGYEFWCPN